MRRKIQFLTHVLLVTDHFPNDINKDLLIKTSYFKLFIYRDRIAIVNFYIRDIRLKDKR